jgi:hypothetical protein
MHFVSRRGWWLGVAAGILAGCDAQILLNGLEPTDAGTASSMNATDGRASSMNATDGRAPKDASPTEPPMPEASTSSPSPDEDAALTDALSDGFDDAEATPSCNPADGASPTPVDANVRSCDPLECGTCFPYSTSCCKADNTCGCQITLASDAEVARCE